MKKIGIGNGNGNGREETKAIVLTPKNARGEFLKACLAFADCFGREHERQRLLEILRNNDSDCRNILVTYLCQGNVIRAFAQAIFRDDVEILQAFHDIGMNVDAKDRYGNRALAHACTYGKEDSVRWLLDHNADVNIEDNHLVTPLMCAIDSGKATIVEMLLEKNANPDLQNGDYETALMIASKRGNNEIVRLLLNRNADTELKNYRRKTALEMAVNDEIKELLQNHVNCYVLK